MAIVGTRLAKLEIDGSVVTGLTNLRISAGDSDNDTVTFEDAAAGGSKDYSLAGTSVQDTTTGSLWDLMFTSSGTDKSYTFMPFGNEVPSAEQPHFTGTVTIGAPDGDFLGGDANVSATAKQTFDFSWLTSAKPVKVTSGS